MLTKEFVFMDSNILPCTWQHISFKFVSITCFKDNLDAITLTTLIKYNCNTDHHRKLFGVTRYCE